MTHRGRKARLKRFSGHVADCADGEPGVAQHQYSVQLPSAWPTEVLGRGETHMQLGVYEDPTTTGWTQVWLVSMFYEAEEGNPDSWNMLEDIGPLRAAIGSEQLAWVPIAEELAAEDGA